METFVIIETNCGFVWAVIEAESALEACSICDAVVGDDHDGDGMYVVADKSVERTTRGCYDVRIAPKAWLGQEIDGTNEAVVAAAHEMPRAGLFAWVSE